MLKSTQSSGLVDKIAEVLGGLAVLGLAVMLVLAIVQAIAALVGAGPEMLLSHWALAVGLFGLLLWMAHGLRARRRWARFGVIIYCVVLALVHVTRVPWGIFSILLAGVVIVVALLLARKKVGREFERRDG